MSATHAFSAAATFSSPAASKQRTGEAMHLIGRRHELTVIEQMIALARRGSSSALVVQGAVGLGKTSLLAAAASRAPEFELFRAGGVRSEIDVPFAGLHQLLNRALATATPLSPDYDEALKTAFGFRGPVRANRLAVSAR